MVRVEGDQIVAREHRLIRPPKRPIRFTEIHGITWSMVANEPVFRDVWPDVAPLFEGAQAAYAHNASFDRGFWLHEMALAEAEAADSAPSFGCTLLLSRRLYPEAANHKLGTLARLHGIVPTGRAHRALADAEMAAGLWLRIVHDVQDRYTASVPFGLLCALQRTPRQQLSRQVARYFASA